MAGAATSFWYPWPTTTTSTAPPTASAVGCAAGDITNTVQASSPGEYIDPNSPTVQFTIGTPTTASIRWVAVSPAVQTRVVSFYSKVGFVNYAGRGPTSVPKSSTTLGTLSSVTVCTTPSPAATSSTAPPPTAPPSAGSCGTGNVQNVVVWDGAKYVDATSPGLNFSLGSSSISWSRVSGVSQLAPGSAASYQSGSNPVSASTQGVAVFTTKGRLLALVVCTTTP